MLYSQHFTFHRKLLGLVSRIEKSGTGDNNFGKWKGTFRWTTFKAGPEYGPFHLMYQPKLPKFWVEWKAPKIWYVLFTIFDMTTDTNNKFEGVTHVYRNIN